MIIEIYFIRAFAIILVILSHLQLTLLKGYLPPEFFSGWTGVDVFFIISGYLVSNSFLKFKIVSINNKLKSIEIVTNYIKKRFVRILPAAWIWALITLIFAYQFNSGGYFGNPSLTKKEFWAVIFFYYNYFTVENNLGILGQYWSLAVEEHFYIFLPIIYLLISRKTYLISFLFIILAFVSIYRISSYMYDSNQVSKFIFLTQYRIDGIILGCLISLGQEKILNFIYLVRSKMLIRLLALASVLFLTLAPGAMEYSEIITYGYTLFALSSALLLILAIRKGKENSTDSILYWILHFIGVRSYTYYLTHFPILLMFMEIRFRINESRFFSDTNQIFYFTTAYFITFLIVSEATYRLLEIPFIKISKKI